MKKLLAPFCLVIFLTACFNKDKSKKIIPSDKIRNVLIDIHLLDATLDYNLQPDSMSGLAKARYGYLMEKYDIDSAQFANSLQYYIKNKPKEIVDIYTKVIDSLENLKQKFAETDQKFYLPLQEKLPDSTYYSFDIPFKIDSNLLKKTVVVDSVKTAVKTDSIAKVNKPLAIKPKERKQLLKKKKLD